MFRCWRFLTLLQPLKTKIAPICSNGTVKSFRQTKVFSIAEKNVFFLGLRKNTHTTFTVANSKYNLSGGRLASFAACTAVFVQNPLIILLRERHSLEFHLLCRFMVAWAGHVGHVGCYGLDLPHKLISDPGVVLEQCHSAVKHDAKRFPVTQDSFIFLYSSTFSQIRLTV